MRLLRGSVKKDLFVKGCAVTIGNFDGVHTGHQHLINKLRLIANEHALPTVVILFEPQPSEFFARSPARLTCFKDKMRLLDKLGVDYAYCINFNQKVSLLNPEEFAHRHLFMTLNSRLILVGKDFRFGYRRGGDVDLLEELARQYDCKVMSMKDFNASYRPVRVSSTLIRELLQQGNMEKAQLLLGRYYNMSGRVIAGAGRARHWKIPTANIQIKRAFPPILGVYCVSIHLQNFGLKQGVANLGVKPTLNGQQLCLEVHILEFDQDIYGENVEVFFLHKLRDEVKFSSLELLIQQIHSDIRAAKAYFLENTHYV
jgi:riboflavin kinase/FMN adenylyltransferase